MFGSFQSERKVLKFILQKFPNPYPTSHPNTNDLKAARVRKNSEMGSVNGHLYLEYSQKTRGMSCSFRISVISRSLTSVTLISATRGQLSHKNMKPLLASFSDLHVTTTSGFSFTAQ